MVENAQGKPPITPEQVVAELAGKGIEVAHVGIYDLMGTFRERRLKLGDVLKMFGNGGTFVNVLPQWDAGESVFGAGPFLGEEVAIDPASVRGYPFEADACMIVGDYTGQSAAFSAKQLLHNQIHKAESMGYGVRAAFESEFFVLQEDAESLRENRFGSLDTFAKDNRCWSGESAALHAEFVKELESTLLAGDIPVQSLSLELGPGCFEVTLGHTDPMRAAEDHLALKMFTKAFCRQRNLTASFMAQLDANFPGLSQHPHVSLFDLDTGKNIFVGREGKDMSDQFEKFIAGMVTMIPQAMPLTHHNPNAYRRLAPGNWSPKSASWARQNYSSAIRAVTNPEESCRLEFRLPGADANPYLNLAFVLGAGLWGLENNAVLGDEFTGGSPDEMPAGDVSLPHDLLTAIHNLENSDAADSIWGAEFLNHFITAMKQEESALRMQVSAAERARYLEIV